MHACGRFTNSAGAQVTMTISILTNLCPTLYPGVHGGGRLERAGQPGLHRDPAGGGRHGVGGGRGPALGQAGAQWPGAGGQTLHRHG